MAEKVEIDIDVNGNLEPSIKQLRELKKQLKEAAAGSEEFKKISKNIKDVEDSLEESRAGAKGFVDMLEEAPGPLGNLFKGLRNAEIATKGFGTALKATGIGLIVAAIGGLVAAFSNVEGAQKKLQPIMIAFERILGGIFRALEPMIDAFLDLALKALPYVTKGIGIFYSALVGLFTYIKEAGTGVAKVWKGIFTLDAKVVEEGMGQIKNSFATAAKAGVEAYGRFETGSKELTKTEKEENEKRQKLADEAAAKRKAAADKAKAEAEKRAQEEEKRREEAKAKLDAANAAELEAFKETLSEQERAEYEAGLKRNERIAALQAAGKTDFTLIEQAYQKELADIRQKAADDQAEKQKEIDEKEKERLLKKAEEQRNILLNGLQQEFDALDRANKQNQFDFEQDLERLAEQRTILDEQMAVELQNEELTEFEKTQIRQRYADLRRGITDQEIATERAAVDTRREINLQYIGLFEQFGALLGQVAGKSKGIAIAGLLIEKGAAIAKIITQMNSVPPILPPALPNPAFIPARIGGALSIAATLAATAKGIQQINSAASSAGISGGGSGASAGGGAVPTTPPPTFSGAPAAMNAPQIQSGQGVNATSQIAQSLAMAQSRPIKAYVVSQDISSQTALDRRTNQAATFSGG